MNNLKLIESGLIKVYKTDVGEYVVDSRELWQGLECTTKFADWIKRRLAECDAIESEDYFSFLKNEKREIGGTTIKNYIIKLDTAKEMAMLERNDIGKQYRRYFIEVEKKYRNGETAKVESSQAKNDLASAKLKNAKARMAAICLKIAEQVAIPEYKQIMYSKATEILFDEMLLPLPKTERKTYTAEEIGQKLGISANMVGRLANGNNLKTADYGIEVWDKAKHSSKQVATWRYYDDVLPVLQNLIK